MAAHCSKGHHAAQLTTSQHTDVTSSRIHCVNGCINNFSCISSSLLRVRDHEGTLTLLHQVFAEAPGPLAARQARHDPRVQKSSLMLGTHFRLGISWSHA